MARSSPSQQHTEDKRASLSRLLLQLYLLFWSATSGEALIISRLKFAYVFGDISPRPLQLSMASNSTRTISLRSLSLSHITPCFTS